MSKQDHTTRCTDPQRSERRRRDLPIFNIFNIQHHPQNHGSNTNFARFSHEGTELGFAPFIEHARTSPGRRSGKLGSESINAQERHQRPQVNGPLQDCVRIARFSLRRSCPILNGNVVMVKVKMVGLRVSNCRLTRSRKATCLRGFTNRPESRRRTIATSTELDQKFSSGWPLLQG